MARAAQLELLHPILDNEAVISLKELEWQVSLRGAGLLAA
jgi:hypothetical protein